ncbi:hypothetical protein BGW37DRAFT_135402 [Umbelopsis sp. PMI_123]|nr:hypothetical protein BGW37DRAFT_135402 [Umbelopsis sp. PMI_123]
MYDSLSFCFLLLFGFDVLLFPLFKYLWTTSSFYMFWMPDQFGFSGFLSRNPNRLFHPLGFPLQTYLRRIEGFNNCLISQLSFLSTLPFPPPDQIYYVFLIFLLFFFFLLLDILLPFTLFF